MNTRSSSFKVLAWMILVSDDLALCTHLLATRHNIAVPDGMALDDRVNVGIDGFIIFYYISV